MVAALQARIRVDAAADHAAGRAAPTPSSAVTTVAGLAVLPLLGQSLLPSFKERDFLMHWLTKPGHLAAGDGPDHRRWPTPSC